MMKLKKTTAHELMMSEIYDDFMHGRRKIYMIISFRETRRNIKHKLKMMKMLHKKAKRGKK
jgi:hypothetical protein